MSKKLPYARFQSIMAKLDNELAKEKLANKKASEKKNKDSTRNSKSDGE